MIRLEHLSADVLDLAPFARAALSGQLDPSLVRVPRSIATWPRPDDHLDLEARAELARTLERELAPLAPHVRVLDAVRSLAEPNAFAVVTGQQPGFLTSPLYSLYKALQSIALARRLSAAWGTPVVALFWNHADDHDVAEVHHAHVVNVNLDLQKIALAGLSSGRLPLSRIVLDDEVNRLPAIRALLAQLVDKEPFAERALDVFVPRHGESFARAFTRAFTELLGPLGLVVVEPDWIRVPLSRELARIVALDPRAALEQGAERVKHADFELAIESDTAALVFALDARGRRALRVGGDGFQYDGEEGSRTCAELAAEIVQDPLAWSPGALLRPIVQDLVLPVAAYVGGFGELAYHAQLGPLRDRAHAPRTAFVPRISMTLVDPESRHSLARLDTDVATVLRAHGNYVAGTPDVAAPAVLAKMRAIARTASVELVALRAEVEALDPGLAPQLKRAGDEIERTVDKLAEKGERVHLNKSGKGKRHERRVNNQLFPRQMPQERVLGPFMFVARFGEDWIHELERDLDPLAPEHVVVMLDADQTIAEDKS